MFGVYSVTVLWGVLGLAYPGDGEPVTVRVGIVAYEDFHREYDQFESIFGDMARRDPLLRFKLAVGSYGEVLHWLDGQQIDVGVLTPGVYGHLLNAAGEAGRPCPCDYLATVQLPAAISSWAMPDRRNSEFSNSYRSVCLAGGESSIASADDLRREASDGNVELLFVHPLSVSGCAAPLEALRRADIASEAIPIRYTYSHSQSIRLLSDPSAVRERVAFVWDDAARRDGDLESGVRRVSFPELDGISIPHDVVVARKGFEHSERVRELLLTAGATRYRFSRLERWGRRYERVGRWLDRGGKLLRTEDGQRISLDEICGMLLQYARSRPTAPRLALVLSGGGAKCAYQVGAVSAIEQRLHRLRRNNPKYPIDIELVVGTSGGAINSLPAAMGISGTKAGWNAWADTWTGLNQCEIIRPPLLVRVNMGLWFALLQTAFVIGVVRRWVADADRRGWFFAVIYTVLAGLEVLAGYVAPPPWRLLGTNHILHHIWLWFSFGVKASAWSLLAIGVCALILQTIRSRRGDHIRLPRRLTRAMLATGLLGLPLLQLVTITAFEETLSGGEGMEETVASQFPVLINRYLTSEGKSPLETSADDPMPRRLHGLSRRVIERDLLERDLVITGSCLGRTTRELPSDLYFYASANGDMADNPYAEHGVSLRSHSELLLDVILGSSSIYPVFPARDIAGIPGPGEAVELVDGGFAHNSPVEAAVLWGATHVILIDVIGEAPLRRGNLLQNVASSVRHLHRQAQLLDVRFRDKVTVFTLTPEPSRLCIIDFASNLVAGSIERGYWEASGRGAGTVPPFRREFGTPAFWDVVP